MSDGKRSTLTVWVVSTRGMQDSTSAEEAGHKLGANEALVVKVEDLAVLRNSHDALVAALERITQVRSWGEAREIARAALAEVPQK